MERQRIMLWAINLLSLLLFLSMFLSVINNEWLTKVDRGIDNWIIHAIHTIDLTWLTPLMKLITDMNSLSGAMLFAAIVIAFFIGRRWYRETGFFLLDILGAATLFVGIKLLVARPRPATAVIEIGGYSFPSGHTTMATAMAFGCYFIFQSRTKHMAIQIILLMMALGWSLLIASTRLYLGVHWFTDVIGGFGLGLWWVTLVRLLWDKDSSSHTTFHSHGSASGSVS